MTNRVAQVVDTILATSTTFKVGLSGIVSISQYGGTNVPMKPTG